MSSNRVGSLLPALLIGAALVVWRASDATIAWAKSKLGEFSGVPTIIATHEILTSSNDVTVNDAAVLSGYGQTLWGRVRR